MHQRALALFEDLASEAPADAELRREVERSYAAIALLLSSLGQKAEALAAAEPGLRNRPGSGRGRPRRYRAPERAGAGRTSSWRCFSLTTLESGEGLEALERARAIQEDLVRSNPSDEQLPTRARPDVRRPGHAARRVGPER